jgi:hypothetical protein
MQHPAVKRKKKQCDDARNMQPQKGMQYQNMQPTETDDSTVAGQSVRLFSVRPRDVGHPESKRIVAIVPLKCILLF